MSNSQPCVIACSATGGRFPMMVGILDYLENEILRPLGYEPLRIGSSGGTLAAMARTITEPGEDSVWWLEKVTKVSGVAKIGGVKLPLNIWNLCMHGGLLASHKLLPTLEHLIEGPHRNGSTAACMFSVSSRYEARILLDPKVLTSEQITKFVAASMSLQFAISPTEILNRDLPVWLQKKWGVVDHPDNFSVCSDGGTGSYLPVSLRGLHWNVPAGTPVIGIALDPVGIAQYRPEGLVGNTLQGGNPISKIWKGCWSVVAANSNEDWEKAVADNNGHPSFLFTVPTPKHLEKYELRFDHTFEEAMEMYEYGYMEAKRKLKFPLPGTENETLDEVLANLFGKEIK